MGWATVVSCDVACHVMSFDVLVMSFDAMWLLVLCHVTWCNAMSCDVRSWKSCRLLALAMGWNVMSLKRHYSLNNYSVLQSPTPVLLQYYKVLLCTTKYYSSTTLYYKVLLQYYSSTTLYYSVLQSTTPVLIWTTKYYSSTTLYYKDSDTSPYYKVVLQYLSGHPYYKVLLQYYSVPQSTTPVLLCTTRYYCYSVLNSTTYYSCTSHAPTSPNAAPATQNDCHDWSCSHMKRYWQCAKQHKTPSNFTKCCTCHAKWLSWLIVLTYETLLTMRDAAQDTLQLHQMLHLPRKMTVMIDRAHIWNVIYKARCNRHHPQTSPNMIMAPATQNECHDWLIVLSYENVI